MRLGSRPLMDTPDGEMPIIKTPISVVDCNASTMSMASGGEYLKRDHKHLDKNAVGQTHDSLLPPTDIFEADAMMRGLGGYIMKQREAMQVDSSSLANDAPVVDAPVVEKSAEIEPSLALN